VIWGLLLPLSRPLRFSITFSAAAAGFLIETAMGQVILRVLILPYDVNAGMIRVPREVAVCPYCTEPTPLVARMVGWEEANRRRGLWRVSEIELECTSEPELFDDEPRMAVRDEWEEWMNIHSYMPYLYWLPVDLRVLSWINELYRFVMVE